MSPVQMAILMNIYYSPVWQTDYRDDDFLQDLLNAGIIDIDTDREIEYRLTPRGMAWVQDILNTPYPQPAFLDKAGNVIEID